jgi:molybdopterin-guanine dinucleotide biosynthesis protein A
MRDMGDQLSVVILAGGKSSRMGQDKALLPVGGQRIVDRIVAQLGRHGSETIVITNTPDDYRFLGLPLFGDVLPDKGALGGLYTALYHASQPYALVVACDMPFVNQPLLDHLRGLAPQHDAVVPRLNGEAEPFRAIYSRACLGPMRAALDAGKMRVISFFPEVRVRFVDEPEIDQFDREHLTFFNVNTPDDLTRAEALAQREAWDADERG